MSTNPEIKTYWVPEDCICETADECLTKFPQYGAAALMANHNVDRLKMIIGTLREAASDYSQLIIAYKSHLAEERKEYASNKESNLAAILMLREALTRLMVDKGHESSCHCEHCLAQHALSVTSGYGDIK